jgi:hypothetical protein
MRCFVFIVLSTLLLPLSATAADLPLKISKVSKPAPLAHLCPSGEGWCSKLKQCQASNLGCSVSPAKKTSQPKQ